MGEPIQAILEESKSENKPNIEEEEKYFIDDEDENEPSIFWMSRFSWGIEAEVERIPRPELVR